MMMLTKDTLHELMQIEAEFCVSIFMHTHRAGKEIEQNYIRFKNLIQKTESDLLNRGLRSREVSSLLEPARKLLADGHFWRHQSDGLAVFVAPDFFKYFRVPHGFEESLVVSDRFYIKPLMPLLTGDGIFYILAVSQNRVRLLQGTKHSVSEEDLEDLAVQLQQALEYEYEKQLQMRSQGPEGMIYHGHGGDESRESVLKYLRLVDSGLRDFLRHERAPLVFAGVEYLFPMYKEVNTYPFLLERALPGNPEDVSAGELHRQAWNIVEPYFKREQQQIIEQYQVLAGTGLSGSAVEEVMSAAYFGRVEVLMIESGSRVLGSYDREHDRVEVGDRDLLNLMAVYTLLNRGTVYVMNDVPDRPVAAIFRY